MNKIKENRLAMELTQQQLADKSGLYIRIIQKYEKGEIDLLDTKVSSLLKLAKVFNCKIEDLLDEK